MRWVNSLILKDKMMFWRRGSESNRRIRLLQSPALPLGYPAAFVERKIVHHQTSASPDSRSNAACKKGKSAAQALKPESQSAKLVILLKKFTPTTVLSVMPSHGTSHYSLCNDNRKTLRRKNQRKD